MQHRCAPFSAIGIYLSNPRATITGSLAPMHASEGSSVHKVIDGLDLMGGQVLDERELVNALDIERPSVRKLDVQNELQKKERKKSSKWRGKPKNARFTAKKGTLREPKPFLGTLRCRR
jgi:hypothetical protein